MLANFTVEKIVNAIISTEGIAAFFGALGGALAAFFLEALRRWRAERVTQIAAGNEAIFALSQMYARAVGIYQQQFIDRAKFFREQEKRDPNYAEILPIEQGRTIIRIQLDRLGFLLRSHDPDLLNRLVTVDTHFDVLMQVIEKRNTTQVEWQKASATAIASHFLGQTIPFEILENLIGIDLSFRLKHMTEALQQQLPECAENLKTVGKQLTDALLWIFPTGRINSFIDSGRRIASPIPTNVLRPRLWRRMVRCIVKLARKPIMFH